jgi:salicylate hydroxylase
MNDAMVIVGAGIGGLASALACARQGRAVRLLEQSPVLGEIGAGIQLGPNAVRLLNGWGLGPALQAVAAYPERLEVRHARSAALLGVLPLGHAMVQRYGAAYATVARADLHGLLLSAVQQSGAVDIQLASPVVDVAQDAQGVTFSTGDGTRQQTPLLVGADGLWSRVRAQVWQDGAPRATGHLAFRAMVRQSDLPQGLRSQVVTAWLGPDFHVVQYPVRGGEWLNLVVIAKGTAPADLQSWDHGASAAELRALLANAGGPLLDLIHTIDTWRLWALCDRVPMRGLAEHAQGRIALLGDAAHPMRPYLAQGAGMAIEDAQQLAASLAAQPQDTGAALQHYAQARWQRNARVQARAQRNGDIFHMKAPLSLARDASLRLLGARLLDVPWLYGYAG